MKTYSRKNSSYLKKAFVASNFNETCRLCLSEVDVVMIPIFQDTPISYQERIHFSVDVLVEEGDGLPTNICEECLGMVEQTYSFKKRCKASDSKLREHLQLMELHDESRLNDIALENAGMESSPSVKKRSNFDKCTPKNLEGCASKSNKELVHTEVFTIEVNEDLGEVQISESIKPTVQISQETTNEEKVSEKTHTELSNEEATAESETRTNISGNIRTYSSKNYTHEDPPCESSVQELTQLQNVDIGFERNDEPVEEEGELDKTARIQEICQLWGNDDEEDGTGRKAEREKQEAEEEEDEEEESLVLDVTWEDGSSRNVQEQGLEVIEVKVEENGVIQTHKVFTSEDRIQIIEAVPEKKSHVCGLCNSAYFSQQELKQHLAFAHKELSDVTFCDICRKSFTCSNSLKRHMSVHTGLKPFTCNVCGRRFSQSSILKRHMFTHVNSKPFACRFCKKSYTQKMNLLTHLRKHGFKMDKDCYRCKICSKTFVHPSGLSRHIKSHKGIRFECPNCSRSFTDSSAMLRHVKGHHPNAKK